MCDLSSFGIALLSYGCVRVCLRCAPKRVLCLALRELLHGGERTPTLGIQWLRAFAISSPAKLLCFVRHVTRRVSLGIEDYVQYVEQYHASQGNQTRMRV